MLDAVVYDRDHGVREFDAAASLDAARDADGTTWVRAHETDRETFDRVAEVFGIHALAVEDVVNNVQPKAEEFQNYTFCLVKATALLRDDAETPAFDEVVRDDPVGVFFGDDWVVTMSTARLPSVDRVRQAVAREDERLLQRGPDFTAYRVLDVVVDGYFDVLDDIEASIEDLEELVLVTTDIEVLERVNGLRRELLAFRKLAWPARDAVGVLARGDPDQVAPETEKYFRDVADHLVQVVDLVETYRELVRGSRDIYLNTLSQSTNEVMKRLTVVAVIFLPLTFFAGLFGMNFETMPELGWPYAYHAALFGMAAVAAVLALYFNEQGYL
ncbi:magnesium/cobalt transporter CorA [Haloglomus litoreum]|uniref:magnesium/cobalt transporter CorA n=1 Tax=Haloglomus litoreum TaxID=3034026 RepID=UPI0023E86F15|nr:magnesium/cobalt transporter CorA [Haloglomus sp. DT116]